MIHIQVIDQFQGLVDESLLQSTASAVLKNEECDPECELTIVIEDNPKLQELNLGFLGIDAPTDVLSFPAGEIDPETGNTYLGDVIISYPKAKLQSESAGHPLVSELQLLIIHGTLHLLGYDHDTPEAKSEMWSVQTTMLKQLEIDIRSYPE